MPVETMHSPPLHRPGEVTTRPKGILKNPSFSGPSGDHQSPTQDDPSVTPLATPLDPEQAKEVTLQNTLQNAGHRRSSSAARRQSATRRHSSGAGVPTTSTVDEDPEKMRLKWDEANLYLAEQESGGRMKITEPKTPYQYGDAMNEDEEDEVAIDPRYVNVDEVEMAKKKGMRKSRESDIPGLELGEAEDEMAGTSAENERIHRGGSLSRESSKDKHVSVQSSEAESDVPEQAGMFTGEEAEKHRQFEEQRKKHYEMSNVKNLLGHPDDMDDEEEVPVQATPSASLPSRRVNGA